LKDKSSVNSATNQD